MRIGLPRSLRAQITTASVLAAAIVLGSAAALTVVVHRGQLIERIDDSLEREALQLSLEISEDVERAQFLIRRPDEDRFVQLVDESGAVWAASAPVLAGAPVTPVGDPRARRLTLDDIPLEDDQYRVLVAPADFGDSPGWVIAGENTDDVGDSIVGLVRILAILLPLATAVLGVLAWFMVGRTLEPVSAIQRQVGDISLHRLSDRVVVPASQDEIASLAETMNAMLDRLDHANERQQRFVADASHELRSPLTRLRTSLEVDLGDPSRDLNVTGVELVGDIQELQRLIDELLFLARSQANTTPHTQQVELDAVIDRVLARVVIPADVRVDTRDVLPVELTGDESQVTRLVDNLVTNALRHCGRHVWLQTQQLDGQYVLVVEDDGPGVAVDDRAKVFERFARLDESRTGATGGAGLGLAIVAEIARLHDADVSVETGRTGGARFVVEFPAG